MEKRSIRAFVFGALFFAPGCILNLNTDSLPELAAVCSLFCASASSQTVASGPDISAPTFAGLTAASAIDSTGIRVSWTAASDDSSAAGAITYEICVSTAAGTCQSNFTATYTTAAGATSFDVTGLQGDTNHYFVVRARDAAGNGETNTAEVTVSTSPIYFFDMGMTSGLLGGRAGADGACQDARNNNFPNLGCTTFHALVSVSATEEVRDLPVPAGMRVMDSTFTNQISIDWAGILDGNIDMSLSAAGVITNDYLTGSGTLGNLHPANCTGFNSAGGTARSGNPNVTGLGWINSNPISCGGTEHIVCVCW